MRLGIDISTYFDELRHSAKYRADDKEVDPIDILRLGGVDIMRIRLWIEPYAENGVPYLGGTCDMQNFLRLASVAKEKGFSVMLDIHYSDFWADPAKQMIPKSWKGLTKEETTEKVYTYTVDVLNKAKMSGVNIEFIQVGNEITNGMLWPLGRLTEHTDGSRGNYEPLIGFIKAGCKGCREVFPDAGIVLHLERSHDRFIYDEFFTNMAKADVDFDIIGFSYYPYWHGTFGQFFANVDMCKKFNKKLMVVELGYAFTLEDYIKNEHGGAKLVVSEDNVSSFAFTEEYPISPEGQARFTEDFLLLAESHGISAVIWWEPLWIPGDGICWSSEEGLSYIGEEGKSTRNEWANQCLFDYSGNALPALNMYKIKHN